MAKSTASQGPQPLGKKSKRRPRPRPQPQPDRTIADDQPITTRKGTSLVTSSGKVLAGDLR